MKNAFIVSLSLLLLASCSAPVDSETAEPAAAGPLSLSSFDDRVDDLLAKMTLELEGSRALLYRACSLVDQNHAIEKALAAD